MMRWEKVAVAFQFNKGTADAKTQRAQTFMEGIHGPNEIHGLGGHCTNPKCDYEFNNQDVEQAEQDGGWIDCPQCHTEQNIWDTDERELNRVGLTPSQMGDIGESVVKSMGNIPELGEITWTSNQKKFPIDMIAGDFGVEIKTNHSESQARFKLGGGNNPGGSGATLRGKMQYVEMEGLRPALVGVRLNFYTDKADIFVRPDSFTDTWIGAPALKHVATLDFTNLNPFKRPEDVPPPSSLPEDSDIPF